MARTESAHEDERKKWRKEKEMWSTADMPVPRTGYRCGKRAHGRLARFRGSLNGDSHIELRNLFFPRRFAGGASERLIHPGSTSNVALSIEFHNVVTRWFISEEDARVLLPMAFCTGICEQPRKE